MKKLSLIGMGLVLLMAMTQCKKAETPSANDNEGEKVHITLEVDNGSKNLVHPETGTAFFTNGDKVLVANNGHYVGTLTYSNHLFEGDVTGADESDYLHFYFMGNQDLIEGTPSSNTTSFTVNISDQTDCYPQIAYNHSTALYSELVTSYKACLLNQCALVKFTTNEINVETVVTLSGLNNQVSVDLGSKEFTFSQTNGGNIALHAESTTSRWAILLSQTDLSSVTANAFGFDEASVSFAVPSINENDYLTGGASFTMTCPALTFKARTAGVSVAINNASAIDLQFSLDGVNWENYTGAITLTNVGDIVSFRGNNTMFSTNSRKFTCIGQCYIYGNVMSLLHANDYASNYELSEKAFTYLFDSNQYIDIDPDKELVLPALELAPYCYQYMFKGCTSLQTAPALPATKLDQFCYSYMFQGCTGLQTAPALPATKLASSCYSNMFYSCSGLRTAPAVLPATELTSSCYNNMFYGCSKLTTAPVLPATTLVEACYNYMFRSCTQLSSITCLATSGMGTSSSISWVQGVASTGTFTKASGVTWPSGISGIPSGWAVQDYSAK